MTQIAEPRPEGASATSDAALRINHWIDGRLVAGVSGRAGPVFNPATGRRTHAVDFADPAEVDLAVAAAKAAFPAWRATSLARRSEIMFRIRQLLDEHRRDLAALLTSQHGKVTSDALGEVARGLENVEFACGVPHLLKGGFSEQVSTGVDVYSIRQPLGVVAGITPFNFPAMVPMWMFANAIACGNTFILKPSEKDPGASMLMAELLTEAGLPDGVFNVVHGDKVAVDRILEHPDIAAVSFVGSTPIARYIYETGTRNGKRVQALGGAKNHMVVLPDADIEMAADAAVSAAYGSAGERCMAISALVAVGASADPLVAAIRERLPKIKVGDGSDPASEMGPLVTREHRDKVASYLDSGQQQGASVLVDGREDPAYGSDGFFLGVSLIDDVTPEMDCYRDEIFGPILTVVRVPTYADALQLINDNPYGNGTAIFTRDGGAARQFQFDATAGMVGINVPIPVPVAYYSFGGWKASLFGDLHMYGPDGISSIPGPRSSPSVGRTRRRRRSTWASRGPADLAGRYSVAMKIALLGAGRIGRLHGTLIAARPEVDEVIVSDVDPARAAQTASAIGGRAAPTVEEAMDGADAVIVAASTDAHARLVLAAVDRGLPVFCEKPLAFDLPETVELVTRIEDRNAVVQVGFQRRFDPGFREARRLIRSGRDRDGLPRPAHLPRPRATARSVHSYLGRPLPRLVDPRLRCPALGDRAGGRRGVRHRLGAWLPGLRALRRPRHGGGHPAPGRWDPGRPQPDPPRSARLRHPDGDRRLARRRDRGPGPEDAAASPRGRRAEPGRSCLGDVPRPV